MFKLIREATPENLAQADRHQWPVRVTAKNMNNSPAYVFVMQQAAPGEWLNATFSCVASAQQMDDLPLTTPGPDGPFYRVDTVTAMCRSAEAALEFGDKVEGALQDLANNLAASVILAVTSETILTPNV